jgi:hypothetical protein
MQSSQTPLINKACSCLGIQISFPFPLQIIIEPFDVILKALIFMLHHPEDFLPLSLSLQ